MGNVAIPRLLKIEEVAQATGIARWRLYELIAAGKGPRVIRIGKSIRVNENQLLAWLDGLQEQPANGGKEA